MSEKAKGNGKMATQSIVEMKFEEYMRRETEFQRLTIANGAMKGIVDAQAEQIERLRTELSSLHMAYSMRSEYRN